MPFIALQCSQQVISKSVPTFEEAVASQEQLIELQLIDGVGEFEIFCVQYDDDLQALRLDHIVQTWPEHLSVIDDGAELSVILVHSCV